MKIKRIVIIINNRKKFAIEGCEFLRFNHIIEKIKEFIEQIFLTPEKDDRAKNN